MFENSDHGSNHEHEIDRKILPFHFIFKTNSSSLIFSITASLSKHMPSKSFRVIVSSCKNKYIFERYSCNSGGRGGLMVTFLYSGSSGPRWSPGKDIVLLGEPPNSRGTSLHIKFVCRLYLYLREII